MSKYREKFSEDKNSWFTAVYTSVEFAEYSVEKAMDFIPKDHLVLWVQLGKILDSIREFKNSL